jgi:endonuclease/exonuclease/phosphatase family metal-dependent hydrolase
MAGCAHQSPRSNEAEPEVGKTAVPIRVAAYNVLFGNWSTPEQMGKTLARYDFDVIGFSEVPDGDWTARVGKAAGMNHVYVGTSSSANHKDKFKSLLSRTPLRDKREIDIPAAGWQPASMVGATTTIRGLDIRIYSLHIPGRAEASGSAAAYIASHIIPNETAPNLIVMGDYNNKIDDPPMLAIEQAGLMPVWRRLRIDISNRSTHQHIETGNESGVIDHVCARGTTGSKVIGGGILDLFNPPGTDKPMERYHAEWVKYGKPLSDHRAVWAELEFAIGPKESAPRE